MTVYTLRHCCANCAYCRFEDGDEWCDFNGETPNCFEDSTEPKNCEHFSIGGNIPADCLIFDESEE